MILSVSLAFNAVTEFQSHPFVNMMFRTDMFLFFFLVLDRWADLPLQIIK